LDFKKHSHTFQNPTGVCDGGGLPWNSEGEKFSTLEKICRERAEIAEREKNFWLAEAAEWARLKHSCPPYVEDAPAQQLDCFVDLGLSPNCVGNKNFR
jgi:hypothetical protein